MCVNNRRILSTGPLTNDHFSKKVFILSEESSFKCRTAVQKIRISESAGQIILGGKDVESLAAQATGDGEGDMNVRVEA
jgi:hypothetical protein